MLLFSKRLKIARKNKGLTQKKLGEIVGVTKVSICGYEKGTRTPTLDTLMDLANALDVEFAYLLGIDINVANDDGSIILAIEEINLIKTLRKNSKVYDKLLNDTDEIVEIIEEKIR